jgi:MFS-type transporter involved in bile tolerance (Atg22 family)
MKYVPVSNIYILSVMMGLSDILASISFGFLLKYFTAKKIILNSFLILSIVAFIFSVLT